MKNIRETLRYKRYFSKQFDWETEKFQQEPIARTNNAKGILGNLCVTFEWKGLWPNESVNVRGLYLRICEHREVDSRSPL